MNSNFVKVNSPKYELYRSKSSFNFYANFSYCDSDLTTIISRIFEVDKKFIYLFSSASDGIIQILKYHKKTDNITKVCIPSFSCTELADAVLSADCEICLYELNNELNPSEEFLESVSGREDIVLIMPSLLGLNTFDESLYNYLKKQKYIVIFDEAQSFPLSPRITGIHKKTWYSIVSFGRTKPISSLGGGAIISHCCNENLYDEAKENSSKYFSEFIKNLADTSLNKMLNYNLFCDFIRKYVKKQKIYSSLEELQDNLKISYKTPMKISAMQEIYAIFRIKKFLQWTSDNEILREKRNLIEIFENKFGTRVSRFIKPSIKLQSVFALYLNNNQKPFIAKKLADVGIQTTLYYFPIHLIKRYSNKFCVMDSNGFKNSLDFISSILILPCNIDYSAKDIKEMCKKVGEIL